jgi:hypothetical protein
LRSVRAGGMLVPHMFTLTAGGPMVSVRNKLVTRATRLRLSAAVGAAAVIGAGTVLAASPARADYTQQSCNTFHSWNECISFDYTNGYLTVSAFNGYATSETEALWIKVGPYSNTQAFDIPSFHAAGFSWHYPAANDACVGIDNVQIVCASFEG